MRKILGLILVAALILSLAACTQAPAPSSPDTSVAPATSAPASEVPAKKTFKIGFAAMSLQGDFMTLIANQLKALFEKDGHTFEVASAEFNPNKQIEVMENFITQGVDAILVMPVDPSNLTDVIKKAQAKGIKVTTFSGETEVYDSFLGVDEFKSGAEEAKMAAAWIDKTFPDAAAGSIQVAILENRDKPTAAQRCDGLKEIEKLTAKAKIAATVGIDTTPAGAQAAAENLLTKNKDIKVVLCYNADTAMGVNAYVTALNSVIKDKSQFATYSVDWNTPAVEGIQKSKTNESVWRGTIRMGTTLGALFGDIKQQTLGTLDGTLKEKRVTSELFQITADNVDVEAATVNQ